MGDMDTLWIGKGFAFLACFLPSRKRRKTCRFFFYHLSDLMTRKKKVCTLTQFACPKYYVLYVHFPNTSSFISVGLNVAIM